MRKRNHRHDYRSTGIDRLDRILHNLREVWYVISGRLIIAIEPEAQAKAEKRRNRIIIFLVAIVLSSLLLIIGVPWIRYFNQLVKQQISNSDGLLFISSFWGAIIGALLAASLTIISTWMIINRSYSVDFHRDRIDHLPILCLHEIRGAIFCEDRIKLPNETFVWSEQEYQKFHEYDEMLLTKILEISNIGAGIALNISTTNGYYEGPPVHFAGITPKNVVYLVYSACTEVPSDTISLFFEDIFENKYRQDFSYDMSDEYNMFFIGGSIPILIEKTKRIRYTQ